MADSPVDLSSTITQAAGDPQSATSDGQSVSSRSIGDLVLADQYLNARAAAGLRRRGMYFSKFYPSGPVSDCGEPRLRGFNRGCGC